MNRRKFLKNVAIAAPAAIAAPTALASVAVTPTYNPMPEMESYFLDKSQEQTKVTIIEKIREDLEEVLSHYLFEYNTAETRRGVNRDVVNYMKGVTTGNGVKDFMVVCDESNNKVFNTTSKMGRNELHIDLAIQPTKSLNFIFIPIRISNTMGAKA